MIAGRMRYIITIRRRALRPGETDGNPRGEYYDAFTTRASFQQTPGVKAVEAGVGEDQNRALLRIYDCAQNRTITAADRVLVDGQNWSIETVSRPDRVRRYIEIVIVRKLGG